MNFDRALAGRPESATTKTPVSHWIPNMRRLCIAFAVLVVCTLIQNDLYAQSLQERVDRQVQPFIDNQIVKGLCVGILHNGQTIVQGYGKVSSEGSEKPNGDTVYEIGSVSKVFTSLLLADAITQKKVRLDQPMVELFPKDQPQPNPSLADIQLVHLSTHTSGLPRLPNNIELANLDDPYSKYSPELLFAFLSQHKLARKPGKKHEYSNLGAGLLGWLIAHQSKSDYPTLVNQQIITPLAMGDTSVTLSDSQKQRFAQGHDVDGKTCSAWGFDALVAAGGLRSTVNDMLKFAAANLKPPANPTGDALELAWKIHQPPLAKSDFAMGLGWLIARDGSTRFHNGQTGGYHSVIYINRELNFSVVVLCNTATGEIDRLGEDIIQILLNKEVEPRTFAPIVKVADDVMQRYVGVYQLVPNVDFTVSLQDSKLMVGLTGQPTLRVHAKSETEWAYRAVEATLTFRQDKDGDWNELVLFQNGIRQKAVRK